MVGNRVPDFLLNSHCDECLAFDLLEIISGDQGFILREEYTGLLHYQMCTIFSA